MDNGKKGSTETSTSRSITIVKNCRARVQARDGTSRARARHDVRGERSPVSENYVQREVNGLGSHAP